MGGQRRNKGGGRCTGKPEENGDLGLLPGRHIISRRAWWYEGEQGSERTETLSTHLCLKCYMGITLLSLYVTECSQNEIKLSVTKCRWHDSFLMPFSVWLYVGCIDICVCEEILYLTPCSDLCNQERGRGYFGYLFPAAGQPE